MRSLSVVIPVYNEAQSLEQLWVEISNVAKALDYQLEIVFVDDGSTDHTWQIVLDLAGRDARVHGVRLRRNFGKAAAIRAGVDIAHFDVVLLIDGDLQDDPQEIPKLMAKLAEGFDMVVGWKRQRKDAWSKRLLSRVFNWSVNWLTGSRLHDHNSGLKLVRRSVFDDVKLHGDMHRFLTVMAAARGFQICEVPVNHRPRRHGTSKYSWSRIPKGVIDLLTVSFLTSFNHRPQHLLGVVGLGSFGLGIAGLIWMSVYWCVRMLYFQDDPDWPPVHQRPALHYSMAALLIGTQLLCLGFLAELMNQRSQETMSPYSLAEQTPRTRDTAKS